MIILYIFHIKIEVNWKHSIFSKLVTKNKLQNFLLTIAFIKMAYIYMDFICISLNFISICQEMLLWIKVYKKGFWQSQISEYFGKMKNMPGWMHLSMMYKLYFHCLDQKLSLLKISLLKFITGWILNL